MLRFCDWSSRVLGALPAALVVLALMGFARSDPGDDDPLAPGLCRCNGVKVGNPHFGNCDMCSYGFLGSICGFYSQVDNQCYTGGTCTNAQGNNCQCDGANCR